MRQGRWRAKLAGAQKGAALSAVRDSLRTGRPFGSRDWTESIARRLGHNLNHRPRGRPRKESGGPKK
jgi:hypothetical protein